MPERRDSQSLLATVVGYVLVAVIAFLLLRVFLGTIVWLLRAVVVGALLVGLLALYLRLKLPRD